MKKFNNYWEASLWAEETDRQLVPVGTSIETDVLAMWENHKSRIELHADHMEYWAERDESKPTYTHKLIIKDFKIVFWEDKSTGYDLDYAENHVDGFDKFDERKKKLASR